MKRHNWWWIILAEATRKFRVILYTPSKHFTSSVIYNFVLLIKSVDPVLYKFKRSWPAAFCTSHKIKNCTVMGDNRPSSFSTKELGSGHFEYLFTNRWDKPKNLWHDSKISLKPQRCWKSEESSTTHRNLKKIFGNPENLRKIFKYFKHLREISKPHFETPFQLTASFWNMFKISYEISEHRFVGFTTPRLVKRKISIFLGFVITILWR